jgi:hypothetical protein
MTKIIIKQETPLSKNQSGISSQIFKRSIINQKKAPGSGPHKIKNKKSAPI